MCPLGVLDPSGRALQLRKPRTENPMRALDRRVPCLAVAALAGAAALVWPSSSEAFVDLGVQGGILKRSLSGVDYNTSFAWQLNGELAFFPLLMVGPYVTFASSSPQWAGVESPSNIDFRTLGLRLKLKLPLSDDLKPYGVIGAGWAHAELPRPGNRRQHQSA